MRSGIEDFSDNALEDRINQIGSGDWGSFLFGVVGGLTGAAGVFATGGAAFAIGVASVGVSSLGGVPKPASEEKSITQAIGRSCSCGETTRMLARAPGLRSSTRTGRHAGSRSSPM